MSEDRNVDVLYFLSDALVVSTLPPGERLKLVCKLLGVSTPDSVQFGARCCRLENLGDRQTRALKQVLNELVQGIFGAVWAGDADPQGLRQLLLSQEETVPQKNALKLVGSYRVAIGLAYALRTVDHQRTDHFHQLLSIAAHRLTYEETKGLLRDAVVPSLLTRKVKKSHPAEAVPEAVEAVAPPTVIGSSDLFKDFPTKHAFKAARSLTIEVGGPGIARESVVHRRLNTMPGEVLSHLLQFVSENRRTLEPSLANAASNKVFALNKDPFRLYGDYVVSALYFVGQ